MMCLKVSSSIQPTSAPTGIDDDMAGSGKADALVDQKDGYCGVQRFKPGRFNPVSTFYDISSAGLHLRPSLKNSVNVGCGPTAATGNVTDCGEFANPRKRVIILPKDKKSFCSSHL